MKQKKLDLEYTDMRQGLQGRIHTKAPTKEYRESYERIFGRKTSKSKTIKVAKG